MKGRHQSGDPCRPLLFIRNMHTKPTIYDPRERQVQVILTDTFQLGFVLESLLAFTGEAADYCLSTLRGLATYKVL